MLISETSSTIPILENIDVSNTSEYLGNQFSFK